MGNPKLRTLQKQHPKFFRAVAADARVTLAYRAEEFEINRLRMAIQIIRLSWASDAFLAQVLYRAKARLQYFRIPIIPTVLHRLAMMHSQVCIGTPVVVEPGIYIAHGQVVIDGFTNIGTGVVIFPWVTVGLKAGNFQGPTVDRNVHIGTGAKVVGPVIVGEGSVIGANAVVVRDVGTFQTVVGIPAEILR
jgi:serine O-acetyltransferase